MRNSFFPYLRFQRQLIAPRAPLFNETTARPSLVVTLKVRAWRSRKPLLCQFWPQLRAMACHPVLSPFTDTARTSPAPPTLATRTRLNDGLTFCKRRGRCQPWHGNEPEGGEGEVEVAERGIAPATGVAGESRVRRADIGGRHHGGARQAPLWRARALDLEAGSTAQPAAEHRGAERRRVGAIALIVKVLVPARPPAAAEKKMAQNC
ncbi:unnamed protein product [Spirodela intermedia]|uniref:Uncharacterized protein n=1 Tax=Spirodela intermedia TaxID=51605 RepID=A0A7I8J2V6_SPIIN|nr:unnamed protein product [Spirodela intermedia]CAA6664535.1 unnamed protein product [Spirodela intermedia]